MFVPHFDVFLQLTAGHKIRRQQTSPEPGSEDSPNFNTPRTKLTSVKIGFANVQYLHNKKKKQKKKKKREPKYTVGCSKLK